MSNDICTQYKIFKIYIKPVLIRELITQIYGQKNYYKSRKLIIFFFLGILVGQGDWRFKLALYMIQHDRSKQRIEYTLLRKILRFASLQYTCSVTSWRQWPFMNYNNSNWENQKSNHPIIPNEKRNLNSFSGTVTGINLDQ